MTKLAVCRHDYQLHEAGPFSASGACCWVTEQANFFRRAADLELSSRGCRCRGPGERADPAKDRRLVAGWKNAEEEPRGTEHRISGVTCGDRASGCPTENFCGCGTCQPWQREIGYCLALVAQSRGCPAKRPSALLFSHTIEAIPSLQPATPPKFPVAGPQNRLSHRRHQPRAPSG